MSFLKKGMSYLFLVTAYNSSIYSNSSSHFLITSSTKKKASIILNNFIKSISKKKSTNEQDSINYSVTPLHRFMDFKDYLKVFSSSVKKNYPVHVTRKDHNLYFNDILVFEYNNKSYKFEPRIIDKILSLV